TMALAPPVVLAAPELLDDDLFVAELVDDGRDDPGAGQERGADLGPVGPGDEQDLVELDLAARLALLAIDDDLIALLDAVLVAAILEDRVHPATLLATRAGSASGPISITLDRVGSGRDALNAGGIRGRRERDKF